MRWDRPARAIRAGVRWFGLGVGALVVGVPLLYVQLVPALVIGSALIHAAGYELPADGLPFLPGAVVMALPLAALLASRTVPRVRVEAPWKRRWPTAPVQARWRHKPWLATSSPGPTTLRPGPRWKMGQATGR